MVKLIVVFLSVLFFSLVFSRPTINESIGSIEAFLPGEGAPICISFEHCKMHDDWTPVVLTIGEFNCLLWMDKDGKVSELRGPGAPFIEPVCIIDAADKSLRKEGGALFFDVY
ncbi:MAG TPA: hypothetical protein VK186_15885, partial [Candidatus Deferrimicrobium sp.]|nr:hypothetical protein [Candidatus Deferrimicrobium sp.]